MKRLALITVLFLLTSVSVRAGEFAETKALAEQGQDAISHTEKSICRVISKLIRGLR